MTPTILLNALDSLSDEELAQTWLSAEAYIDDENTQSIPSFPIKVIVLLRAIQLMSSDEWEDLPFYLAMKSRNLAKLSFLYVLFQETYGKKEVISSAPFKILSDTIYGKRMEFFRYDQDFRDIDEHMIHLREQKVKDAAEQKISQEDLRGFEEEISAQALKEKQALLKRLNYFIHNEKQVFENRMEAMKSDLEKINILMLACLNYQEYLCDTITNLLRKEDPELLQSDMAILSKEVDEKKEYEKLSQPCQQALLKLNVINKLLNVLNDQHSPSYKRMEFHKTFLINEVILTQRRDTPTINFVKIVATVLTCGIAGIWLWKKSKGAEFSDTVHQTFLGKHNRKHLDLKDSGELKTPSQRFI